MRLALFIALLFANASLALAKWVDIPTEDLVAEADLGVIGRPTHTRRYFDGFHTGKGSATLEISRWLYGDMPHTTSLPVQWEFDPYMAASGDIDDDSERLWLLTIKDGKFLRPAYQFILPATTETGVLQATQNPLRAKQKLGAGITTYVLQLTYRNFTSQTLELPLVETRGPQLLLPDSMRIRATRYPFAPSEAIPSFAGKLAYTTSPRSVSLSPGQSHSMEILPAQYFDVSDQDGFTVRWSVTGYHESNPATLYNPKWPITDRLEADEKPSLPRCLYITCQYSPAKEAVRLLALVALACVVRYIIHKRRKRRRVADRQLAGLQP